MRLAASSRNIRPIVRHQLRPHSESISKRENAREGGGESEGSNREGEGGGRKKGRRREETTYNLENVQAFHVVRPPCRQFALNTEHKETLSSARQRLHVLSRRQSFSPGQGFSQADSDENELTATL